MDMWNKCRGSNQTTVIFYASIGVNLAALGVHFCSIFSVDLSTLNSMIQGLMGNI